MGTNSKKKKNYIGRQQKSTNILLRLITSVLLFATVLCISVVALFVFGHPSTKEGGIFYAFLPATEQNIADEIGLINLPPQSNTEPQEPDTLPIYVQQPPDDTPTVVYLPCIPYIPPPPPPEPPTPASPVTPFCVFPFYIPANAPYYEYFQYNNPHLSAETVVWKVNAHLHLPFYYVIHVNYNPNPLLVNPFYRLPPGFVPYPLVPVNNADCHLRATPETVTAFRALRASARESGFDLSATSAYRTATRQAELFSARNYVDGVVARPYHSEHQTGRAIDLWGPGGLLDARGPSPTGRWVAENAHYYGFIIRYRADTTHITGFIYEPWHITYVTIEISMYMHENDIFSLEEFIARHPEATLQRG